MLVLGAGAAIAAAAGSSSASAGNASRVVVCGTQEGALDIWGWGRWAEIEDRFTGHPESVDTMLKIDDSTILTGSSDGLIRVVQIGPNRLLGVIGDHDDFPVERMAWSRDRKIIGSISHDYLVRFWDASILLDDDEEEENEEEEDGTVDRGVDSEHGNAKVEEGEVGAKRKRNFAKLGTDEAMLQATVSKKAKGELKKRKVEAFFSEL